MNRARFVPAVLLVLGFVLIDSRDSGAQPVSPASPVKPATTPRPAVTPRAPRPPAIPDFEGLAPLPELAREAAIEGGVPGGIPGGVPGGVGWAPVGLPPIGEGPQSVAWKDSQGGASKLTPEEEMKAMALNGLRHADPEKAVPVLDKFLKDNNSLPLKRRALSITADFGTPEARAVISRVAHEESSPELQMAAIRCLARFESDQTRKELTSIYAATKNAEVKKTIIRILAGQEDVAGVMTLLRAELDPMLRGYGVRSLGALQARDELRALYSQEAVEEVRVEILRAMQAARDYPKIAEVARVEPIMALKAEAIRRVGSRDNAEAGKALVELYSAEKDKPLKKEILRGLSRLENVKGLIEVARNESDPELKKYSVELLARSRSKEASDFLVELLNK